VLNNVVLLQLLKFSLRRRQLPEFGSDGQPVGDDVWTTSWLTGGSRFEAHTTAGNSSSRRL